MVCDLTILSSFRCAEEGALHVRLLLHLPARPAGLLVWTRLFPLCGVTGDAPECCTGRLHTAVAGLDVDTVVVIFSTSWPCSSELLNIAYCDTQLKAEFLLKNTSKFCSLNYFSWLCGHVRSHFDWHFPDCQSFMTTVTTVKAVVVQPCLLEPSGFDSEQETEFV